MALTITAVYSSLKTPQPTKPDTISCITVASTDVTTGSQTVQAAQAGAKWYVYGIAYMTIANTSQFRLLDGTNPMIEFIGLQNTEGFLDLRNLPLIGSTNTALNFAKDAGAADIYLTLWLALKAGTL